ncbi:MAG: tetratricopeptide repeat protein, partial [Armatimonadota bacterium]
MQIHHTFVIGLIAVSALAGCRTAPSETPVPRPAASTESLELDAARRLAHDGKVVQAVEAFSTYSRTHPTDARPWMEIGKLLCSNGQYADAVDTFLEADKLEPGTTEADAWLALAIG